MTEPILVSGPRLSVNALVLFGQLRLRVVDDLEVPGGYSLEECNGLVRGDSTDFEITWGRSAATWLPSSAGRSGCTCRRTTPPASTPTGSAPVGK